MDNQLQQLRRIATESEETLTRWLTAIRRAGQLTRKQELAIDLCAWMGNNNFQSISDIKTTFEIPPPFETNLWREWKRIIKPLGRQPAMIAASCAAHILSERTHSGGFHTWASWDDRIEHILRAERSCNWWLELASRNNLNGPEEALTISALRKIPINLALTKLPPSTYNYHFDHLNLGFSAIKTFLCQNFTESASMAMRHAFIILGADVKKPGSGRLKWTRTNPLPMSAIELTKEIKRYLIQWAKQYVLLPV